MDIYTSTTGIDIKGADVLPNFISVSFFSKMNETFCRGFRREDITTHGSMWSRLESGIERRWVKDSFFDEINAAQFLVLVEKRKESVAFCIKRDEYFFQLRRAKYRYPTYIPLQLSGKPAFVADIGEGEVGNFLLVNRP